jgi:hypothetical protein
MVRFRAGSAGSAGRVPREAVGPRDPAVHTGRLTAAAVPAGGPARLDPEGHVGAPGKNCSDCKNRADRNSNQRGLRVGL